MPPGHEYANITASGTARQQVGDSYNTTNNYYSSAQRGRDATSRNGKQNVRLLEAAKEGQRLRLQYLLTEAGANVDYEDSDGLTALHCAVWAGYVDCVEFLISRGADVNAKSEVYGTPLCVAAVRGHDRLVQLLLEEHRANPNHPGGLLGSALHAASFACWQDGSNVLARDAMIRSLLSHGANLYSSRRLDWHFTERFQHTFPHPTPSIGGFPSCQPIHLAAFYGAVDAVYLLLDHCADVESKIQGPFSTLTIPAGIGMTPLMLACMKDSNVQLVRILLRRGASCTTPDGNGQTALFTACSYNSSACLALLLEEDYILNFQDVNGRTALMVAAQRGFDRCVQGLVEVGASLTIQDKDGETALTAAQRGSYARCVSIIEQAAPRKKCNSTLP